MSVLKTEVDLTAADSVDEVRRSGCPLFLRIDTHRLMPHSKGDDDRDPQEVQRYREKDPLVLFLQESNPEAVVQLNARHQALGYQTPAAAYFGSSV